jgi:hypothetical protein
VRQTEGMTTPPDPFAAPGPNHQPPPPPPYGAPPPYGQPGPPPPPYGTPSQPPYGAPAWGTPDGGRPSNGLGVAALVLGIVSIFPLFMFVIPAILAIVFGAIGRSRAKRGQATNGGVALAGLLTGIAGLLIGIAFWTAGILAFTSPAGQRFQDCQDRATSTAAQDACTQTFLDELVK